MCEDGKYDKCTLTQPFADIRLVSMSNENDDEPDDDEDDLPLADLVISGSIVAVRAADDPNEEYYLIKATNGSQRLRKDTVDGWGCEFRAGIDVIRCLYFDKVNNNPLHFKLVKRHPAIVPSQSVVYLCN